MLGVGVHVDENGLKAGFRQVVKKIHPDRNYLNNFNQNNNNNVQVEEAFVRVRQVYEALRNPNMRFAYDRFVLPQLHFSFSSLLISIVRNKRMNLRKNRFGPNVLSWTSCRTRRDFMVHGSLQAGGYYIVSGGTLLIWSLFHKSNFLSFVRNPPPSPYQPNSQKKSGVGSYSASFFSQNSFSSSPPPPPPLLFGWSIF